MPQIVSRNLSQCPALTLIDRRLRSRHLAGRPRLYFNKAKAIAIPSDQVDVPSVTMRTPASCGDDVPLSPKVKERSLLSAYAQRKMSGL